MIGYNTGYARSMTLLVRKFSTTGGVTTEVTTGGFPLTVDGKNAFSGYPAISQTDFDLLSSAAFTARLNAFQAYIEYTYPGLTCTWTDAVISDPEMCPVTVVPLTYSLQNITPNGPQEKEFDVVVSNGSTRTINYYLFVERVLPGGGIDVGTYISKSATIAVDGGIVTSLYAAAGATSRYKSGVITIYGSAHIKITLSGVANAYSNILDVRGYIMFDDNTDLQAIVTLASS